MRHSPSVLFGIFSGIFATLVILSQPLPAHAASKVGNPAGKWGLGLILGEPTGFSVQHQNDANSSLNFILAYSFNSWFQASGDLVFYFPGAWRSVTGSSAHVKPYLGGGLAIGAITNRVVNDSVAFAMRVPFGLEYLIPDTALRVFGELVPSMRFVPSTGLFLQGGLGLRIYL